MSKKMTLEQVRDEIEITSHESCNPMLRRRWVGMIDAEIKARGEPVAWLVIDDEGQSQYAASFPEACHDYINEVLGDGYDEAKAWHVIPVYLAPPAPKIEVTDAA